MSCAHSQSKVVPTPNPMPSIWQGIRTDIDALEKSKASPLQWEKQSESVEHILDDRQLSQLTAHLSLVESEQTALQWYRSTAAQTIHYGFEGNHHALVFFDLHNKPSHVLKW